MSKHDLSNEIRAIALEKYKSGLCPREIGEEMGLNGGTVASWIDKSGLRRSRSESNTKFSKEIVDSAIKKYSTGLTVKEIAQEVGASKSIVAKWFIDAGVNKSYSESMGVTKEVIDKAITLFKEGMSPFGIAKLLNVSSTTIYFWIKKAGLSTRSSSEAVKLKIDQGWMPSTRGIRSRVL